MKLNDSKCRNAKPKDKTYKLADGGGLYLQVTTKGQKYWRMKYHYAKKEKLMSFGTYPTISLLEAREKREEAKKSLANDIDPMMVRKAQKQQIIEKHENTFEKVAREWHALQEKVITAQTWKNKIHRLEIDIFPEIGSYPIADIRSSHILHALKKIEQRGAFDIAKRQLQGCGQIFRYAVAHDYCDSDPTLALKGALQPTIKKNFSTIRIEELPDLLRKIDRNENRLFPTTINALKLMILVFVRTSELIEAEWKEFDFDKKVWVIPAYRMKMRQEHIVPLSRQAIEILKDQKHYSSNSGNDFVFPSLVHSAKHMSNNTILKALERLGYKGKMTGHGFRSLAMTAIIEQLKYDKDIPDRQLAHKERNKVMAAYDRSQLLPERTEMMQDWADYIDGLK